MTCLIRPLVNCCGQCANRVLEEAMRIPNSTFLAAGAMGAIASTLATMDGSNACAAGVASIGALVIGSTVISAASTAIFRICYIGAVFFQRIANH